MQYAYMAHFFANPLSCLLSVELTFEILRPQHFEAIRNLPSFRAHAENLLNNGKTALVRSLLDSDEELFNYAQEAIQEGQRLLKGMAESVDVFLLIRSFFSKTQDISRSALYIKAAAGELLQSPMLRELLLNIKRAPSGTLESLLKELINELEPKDEHHLKVLKALQADLAALISKAGGDSATLRSEHDIRNETLRTTVVAQKVELSKQKSTLSKQDASYSRLLTTFCEWVEFYFQDSLPNPNEIFLIEVITYDLKAPLRAVFMPKPRFVVERALSSPHDYLQFETSEDGGAVEALSASQPATTILYQLYLDSAALVNVADLWSAFNAVLGGEEDEEKEQRNK